MRIYLNPSNDKFKEALNSAVYVDKSNLITYTNQVLHTTQKCLCVSRPRRFGKSITANMLAAYYSRGRNSKELFSKLCIAKEYDFTKYMNQYDTIFLNMQEFLSQSKDVEEMLSLIQKSVLWELLEEKKAQERYLDFLRNLLKDKEQIHLVYMTGILPIKKYGTHSALNMFDEYSMINPRQLAEYVGFTEHEVADLCRKYHMNLEEIKDVLTLLVHLGYPGYDSVEETVYIPNNEIRMEYANAISVSQWGEVSKALKNSANTLKQYGQISKNGCRHYKNDRDY